VVYVTGDVFVQIWIGTDDKLPRRIYAIYLNDHARLRHVLELSNWQLDNAIPADAFVATKAAGAARIAFARPDASGAPAMKPPPGVRPIGTQ
jgi:outer membrane lipoprotein-sorting protein